MAENTSVRGAGKPCALMGRCVRHQFNEYQFSRLAVSLTKSIANIVLTCVAALLPMSCYAGTVNVCIPGEDNAPLTFPDHDGQLQWLTRKAIERQGDKVEFVAVPWRRCLDGLRSRTYDAGIPIAASEELFSSIAFPTNNGQLDVDRELGMLIGVVVRRVGSGVNWDGKNFTALTTPVLTATNGVMVKNKLNAMNVTLDSSSRQDVLTLRKLLAGRGDIAILQKTVAEEYLGQKEFRGKLEILPEPFMTPPVFLAFNRSYYENAMPRVEAIWAEIKRLRASKEWKDIAPTLTH